MVALANDGSDPRIARTRDAVYQATIELICEVGYEGLNIDAISRRSGVARSTIYRHWSSVAEVMYESAFTVPSLLVDPASDGRTSLRRVLGGLAERLYNSPFGHVLAASVDAGERHEEIRRLQIQLATERFEATLTMLADGVERGEIRHDADIAMAMEMATGALFRRRLISRQPVDDAYLDALTDFVWAAISARHPAADAD